MTFRAVHNAKEAPDGVSGVRTLKPDVHGGGAEYPGFDSRSGPWLGEPLPQKPLKEKRLSPYPFANKRGTLIVDSVAKAAKASRNVPKLFATVCPSSPKEPSGGATEGPQDGGSLERPLFEEAL
jgi:hypothetical protein